MTNQACSLKARDCLQQKNINKLTYKTVSKLKSQK